MRPALLLAVLLVPCAAFAETEYERAMVEGNALYDRGAWEQARACFERAARAQPASAEPLAIIASTYAKERKWDLAVARFRAALEMDVPRGAISAYVYKELGLTYGAMDRPRESVEAFEQGLRLDPGSALMWRNLGVSHCHLKDWDRAIQAFEASLRLEGDQPKVRQLLEEARQGRGERTGMPAVPLPEPEGAAPADPDRIDRPEYKDRSKALKRNLASIRGMLVLQQADGQEHGLTNAVIAASTPLGTQNGQAVMRTRFAGEVGQEMRISLDEAIRAVRVRYPFWESSEITFSFQDKYTPKDGGSAGMAYALLLLSLLEDIDLDPDVAVTGDITVDWRIQPIGGVGAKLRGASLDGCKVALIPQPNLPDIDDMLLLYPKDVLCKLQIFSVATLQDALRLAPKAREEALSQAMGAFSEAVQGLDLKGTKPAIAAERLARLEQVLAACPNHVSAAALLKLAAGKAPRRLSAKGSFLEICRTLQPLEELIHRNLGFLNSQTYSKEASRKTREGLHTLEGLVEEGQRGLIKSSLGFLKECDALVAAADKYQKASCDPKNPRGAREAALKQHQAALQKATAAQKALQKTIETLGTDRALIEKLIR